MQIYPWREVELTLTAAQQYKNPYTNVAVWADFQHEDGDVIRRPAFWDGDSTWKVRFASTKETGVWTWTSACSVNDPGLAGQSGTLQCAGSPPSDNRFYQHGFWRMSPGKRNLVHADGYPAVLVADTSWALPWRATEEQVEVYAADRQAKGFNAALLMSVQSDMNACGPRNRSADEGFDVGFEDLKDGHLNELNPGCFQTVDRLLGILVEHEIVPILQPVFMGFGWKGLQVAGPVVPNEEYARYCRYLVARYGARPVIYLVGGDGSGYEPQVGAGGDEIEEWDDYQQPAGIHYRPHADNRAHQADKWLDFQWCQTGHRGEHIPERVTDMWRNEPVKAVANGEPTYENGGKPGIAAGWWQGHEAWSNFCAGGTMGVVYGAGSMWQWRLHPDEPGHSDFFLGVDAGWREALDYEGSTYVGLLGKILDGLPMTDIEPNWRVTLGRRSLLVPGKLFIAYTTEAGPMKVFGNDVPLPYRVVDPRNGEVLQQGVIDPDWVPPGSPNSSSGGWIPDEGQGPRVFICCSEF